MSCWQHVFVSSAESRSALGTGAGWKGASDRNQDHGVFKKNWSGGKHESASRAVRK